jgi:hypothetical protein
MRIPRLNKQNPLLSTCGSFVADGTVRLSLRVEIHTPINSKENPLVVVGQSCSILPFLVPNMGFNSRSLLVAQFLKTLHRNSRRVIQLTFSNIRPTFPVLVSPAYENAHN